MGGRVGGGGRVRDSEWMVGSRRASAESRLCVCAARSLCQALCQVSMIRMLSFVSWECSCVEFISARTCQGCLLPAPSRPFAPARSAETEPPSLPSPCDPAAHQHIEKILTLSGCSKLARQLRKGGQLHLPVKVPPPPRPE